MGFKRNTSSLDHDGVGGGWLLHHYRMRLSVPTVTVDQALYTRGMASPETSIRLVDSGEPWVGEFRGLGRVRVWADGRTEVTAEAGDKEPVAQREAALRHGWAEPLSWARRGFDLSGGVAMVDGTRRAILIAGDIHDAGIVALGLAGRGWGLAAHRIVPLRFADSRVTVESHDAPFLTSERRATLNGRECRAVRSSSDSVEVLGLERVTGPVVLEGIAVVRPRRPSDELLIPRRGMLAMERMGQVLFGGRLRSDANRDPVVSMERRVALADLGVVDLTLDAENPDPSVGALLDWWARRGCL